MDCPEEVSLIENAWTGLEGVLEVRTNLLERTATVILNTALTAPDQLLDALRRAGLHAEFTSPGQPPVVQFHLPSYAQPETLPAITTALEHQPAITEFAFDPHEEVVRITFDPRFLTANAVHQIILSTGVVAQQISDGVSRPLRALTEDPREHSASMPMTNTFPPGGIPTAGTFVPPPEAVPAPATSAALDGRLIGLGITFLLWLTGAILLHNGIAVALSKVLLAAVILLTGSGVFTRAFRSALNRRLDMYVLMSVAVLGALAIGEWTEGAMLMWLFAVSLWVEGWNLDRARQALKAFGQRKPSRVRILVDGTWDEIPIERVPAGTRIEVRPGEIIPLDGVVISGIAAVNEAAVTGEAQPVTKEPGSPVLAGTACLNAALQIVTTHTVQNSAIERMQRLVLEAQSTRAPLQGVVDRFALRYTPIVLGLAVAAMLLPPLIGMVVLPQLTPAAQGELWAMWFYRGLALLVLACPCALVISTPVAFVAGLGRAARSGMLVKGGQILEEIGRLKALAFDKTGTLTTGNLELVKVEGYGTAPDDLLRLALALEAQANHPVAIALARACQQRNLSPLAGLTGFQQWGGKGVEGWLGQTPVALGSLQWLIDRGLPLDRPLVERIEQAGSWGATLAGVVVGQRLAGLLAFRDPVRPGAREVLDSLRARGIERIELLTGDNQIVAEAVARETGIEAVHPNLLPEDKPQRVNALMRAYGSVGMVGDGLNDAPALATATIGIAMGERGVDVALETAQVVLVGDELNRLPELVDLSRATVRTIQQNIALALAIKAVFAVFLVFGWLGLWAAVLGDMGGSLAVTANSLRLLRR